MLPNSNVRRKTPLEINFNIHAISKFTAFKNMLHNQLCSFHNMPFISKFYYFLKKNTHFFINHASKLNIHTGQVKCTQ